MRRPARRRAGGWLPALLLLAGVGAVLLLREPTPPREALDPGAAESDAGLEPADERPRPDRISEPPPFSREEAEPSEERIDTARESDPPAGMLTVTVYPWEILGGPPLLVVLRPDRGRGNDSLPHFGLTEGISSSRASGVQGLVPAGHWEIEAHPGRSLTPELRSLLEERRELGHAFAASERIPPDWEALIARHLEVPVEGRVSVQLVVPCRAERGGRVRGRLVNLGAIPLEEVRVGLAREGSPSIPVELRSGGEFDCGRVPAGNFELRVSLLGDGYNALVRIRHPFGLVVGEEVDLSIELPPTVERSFSVIDSRSGAPLEEVLIRLARLDPPRERGILSHGAWRQRLRVGRYVAWVQARDHRASFLEFETRTAEPSATITVRLEATEGDLRTLIGEDGAPVEIGSLWVLDVGGTRRNTGINITTAVREDGFFDAAGWPARRIWVRLSSRGRGRRTGLIDLRFESERILFVAD